MPAPKQTGVTAATWNSLIMDAAVAYLNYGSTDENYPERILGATNGGVSFGWAEFNMRHPEIDGLKGSMKGASRITQAIPQLEVNLVEWSLENLLLAFPGCEVEVSGVGAAQITTLTRSNRLIAPEEYPLNVAMVGTQSGTGLPVVAIIKNPLVVEGVELATQEDSETTTPVIFVGHYDPENPEDEPWEIRFPTPVED
ncbi:hypothetical protein [Roseinatronobacter alkalisoli]|uniref:Uncharacterized protein n=1 Tax=Roseinatronobacter alkalisoli TaxID=3028235 RepID=A0ABT5THQ2_9RHOB|nr:hypothetical protein [Roseinatronobacter sp. HJB301]MDD7973443.1 hypothetical protein [Roseinatronobacter sp. HJB301]